MEKLKTYAIGTILSGSLNLNKLNGEIENSGTVSEFQNISNNKKTDEIEIFGLSILDLPALDLIIENHIAFDLSELKESRFNEIDEKTFEIISAGFTFDGNLFSLSAHAQTNWTNIHSNKEVFNAIGSFPMEISTKDSNIYVLNYDDVLAFWSAGMVAVKTPYNIRGNLKKLIFDAATIEEVNLVIDNR